MKYATAAHNMFMSLLLCSLNTLLTAGSQLTQRTHRLHPVKLDQITAGKTWVWVSWSPSLSPAEVSGQLMLTLSYRWSDPDIPDKDNNVYLETPRQTPSGVSPASKNITKLQPSTWYSVCLNATHKVSSRFSRVTFTCLAAKTLTRNGETPPTFRIVSPEVAIERGATQAVITFTVEPGPYRVVQWEIFLEDGLRATTHFYSSRHDNGRQRSFFFKDLDRDTDYHVNVRLSYGVDVKGNEHVDRHNEVLFFTTLVSRATSAALSDALLFVVLLTSLGQLWNYAGD